MRAARISETGQTEASRPSGPKAEAGRIATQLPAKSGFQVAAQQFSDWFASSGRAPTAHDYGSSAWTLVGIGPQLSKLFAVNAWRLLGVRRTCSRTCAAWRSSRKSPAPVIYDSLRSAKVAKHPMIIVDARGQTVGKGPPAFVPLRSTSCQKSRRPLLVDAIY
jgi:hypothetical protein